MGVIRSPGVLKPAGSAAVPMSARNGHIAHSAVNLITGGAVFRPASTRPNGRAATVTVVIPNFNYARYLSAAIASVLTQEGVVVDVVVVDDASSDDSVAVASRLAASDPRIQVVRQETNRGPVDTFNRGLDHVTGEFLVRLDADDMLTPGSLSRSVSLAQAFPSVGLVYGHPVHFVEDDRAHQPTRMGGWARPYRVSRGTLPPVRSVGRPTWILWDGTTWLWRRCSNARNVITSPEVLMRSSVVDLVGGQKPLAHTHDMEMWLRIAAHADVGYVAGVDQALHRDHDASLSSRSSSLVIDLNERYLAFVELFHETAESDPEHARMLAAARSALAVESVRRATHVLDRRRHDNDVVAELEAFALMSWPDIAATKAWRALQSRDRASSRPPRLLHTLGAARRRLALELDIRRWERWGS